MAPLLLSCTLFLPRAVSETFGGPLAFPEGGWPRNVGPGKRCGVAQPFATFFVFPRPSVGRKLLLGQSLGQMPAMQRVAHQSAPFVFFASGSKTVAAKCSPGKELPACGAPLVAETPAM
jgi:hypothetical protein